MRTMRHRDAKVLARRVCSAVSVLHFRDHFPSYTSFSAQATMGHGSCPLVKC